MKQFYKKSGASAGLLLAVLVQAYSLPLEATLDIPTYSLGQMVFARIHLENKGSEEIQAWFLEIETIDAVLGDSYPLAVLQGMRFDGPSTIRTYHMRSDPYVTNISPGETESAFLPLLFADVSSFRPNAARITKFDYLVRRPTESATYRVDDAIVTVMKVGDWAYGAVLHFVLRSATTSPIPNWEMDFDLAQDVFQYWNSRLKTNGIQKTLYYGNYNYEPFDVLPPAGKGFLNVGVQTTVGGLNLLPLVTRVAGSAPTAKAAVAKPVAAPRVFRLRGWTANIPIQLKNVRKVSVESTGKNRVRPTLRRRSRISIIDVRAIRFGNARVTITATDRRGRTTKHHIKIQRRLSID